MNMSRLALGITLSIIAIAIAVAGCVSFFSPVGLVCPISPRAAFVTHFFDGRMRLFWITRDDQPIRVTHQWRAPAIEIVARSSLIWEGGQHTVPDVRRALRDGDLVRINLGDRRGVDAFGGQWRSGQVTQRGGSGGGLTRTSPRGGAVQASARRGVTQSSGAAGATRTRGVVAQTAANAGGLEVSFLRFPMWVPVLLLLLQPMKAIIFGPWRTRRRERLNQCIGCGYDLRALPLPRCPECGRGIAESSLWDLQFEADVAAGRLDGLVDEGLRDLQGGRCKDL